MTKQRSLTIGDHCLPFGFLEEFLRMSLTKVCDKLSSPSSGGSSSSQCDSATPEARITFYLDILLGGNSLGSIVAMIDSNNRHLSLKYSSDRPNDRICDSSDFSARALFAASSADFMAKCSRARQN